MPMRHLSHAAFLVFAALVATIPVALGGVPDRAWGAYSLAAGLLLALLGALRLEAEEPLAPAWRRLRPAPLLAALVTLYAIAQTLPVPDALANPAWRESAHVLGVELPGRISVDPALTLDALVRLLGCLAVFALALELGRARGRAALLLAVIGGAAVLNALYGIVALLADDAHILWLPKAAYRGSLTGTFVNRNEYAAYLGLGLIALSAGLVRDRDRPAPGPREAARRVAQLLAGPSALRVGGMMLLLAALALTRSRGGLASSLAGLATLLAVATGRGRVGLKGAGAIGLVGLAICLVLASAGFGTAYRLSALDADTQGRLLLYDRAAQMVQAAPWLGHGFGAFAHAFPPWRPPELEALADYAHATYLETVIDLGIPMALVLFAMLALPVRLVLLGALQRRHALAYPAAALAATVLVATHNIADFSVEVPAVAWTYAAIMGLGAAHATRGTPA